MIIKLPPRCLAFYGNDPTWFAELGVKLVDGGVEGDREKLERLARFYTDDADPVQSGIAANMRRNAREAAKRIRAQLAIMALAIAMLAGCASPIDSQLGVFDSDPSFAWTDHAHAERDGYTLDVYTHGAPAPRDMRLDDVLALQLDTERAWDGDIAGGLSRVVVYVPATDEDFAAWCGGDPYSTMGCTWPHGDHAFTVLRADMWSAGRGYLEGIFVHELLHEASYLWTGDGDADHTDPKIWRDTWARACVIAGYPDGDCWPAG